MLLVNLVDIARESTQCRMCFQRDPGLPAAVVDVPQPPFVPHGYWNSRPRVLVIGQNPGAGANRQDEGDKLMRAQLVALRDGEDAAWGRYLMHCEQDMAKWGQYLLYLRDVHASPRETAFGNVAMCAVKQDSDVTDALFETCAQRFLARWIVSLDPTVIILMGGRARSYRTSVAMAAPSASLYESMHYAVGGSHRKALNEQLVVIAMAIDRSRAEG